MTTYNLTIYTHSLQEAINTEANPNSLIRELNNLEINVLNISRSDSKLIVTVEGELENIQFYINRIWRDQRILVKLSKPNIVLPLLIIGVVLGTFGYALFKRKK